eukprot:COSAG01_NODE_3411_length_6127_cov_5.921699_1_plen_37_part_10
MQQQQLWLWCVIPYKNETLGAPTQVSFLVRYFIDMGW